MNAGYFATANLGIVYNYNTIILAHAIGENIQNYDKLAFSLKLLFSIVGFIGFIMESLEFSGGASLLCGDPMDLADAPASDDRALEFLDISSISRTSRMVRGDEGKDNSGSSLGSWSPIELSPYES